MADINHLCSGCMRELKEQNKKQGEACPYCGFSAKSHQQNSRCLPVNTILAGKYLVGKVLGQGGFGITYMGFDLNMETRVAIKEYFPVELASRDTTSMTGDRVLSLSGDKREVYQQGLKKYVAEAQNVSQFSGTPGVVSVKDFFYENETAYIVMEYIDGESLKDYLKEKGGKLTEEETLFIMKPVLEALVKVHASGIIHRDISPDNIMLTFDKSRKITSVKLIDFGAARMTAKNDQKSLTIILKHGYAPEEQYRTHGEQGTWTDVYAVCAVLYRMLTGETPVPAMDRMFQDTLKSFEQFPAKVSKNTAAAIIKGLAVKKENRILTMQELIRVLYEGKAVRGSGSGSEKAAKHKKAGVIAAVGAVIVVAGYLLMTASGRHEGTTSETGQSMVEQGNVQATSGLSQEETTSAAEQKTVITESVSLETQEEKLGEQIAFYDPQNSISASPDGHALFCLTDGTVRARGSNEYGQGNVDQWDHVVSVIAYGNFSVGLRSDGSILFTGLNYGGVEEITQWKDIVSIQKLWRNDPIIGITKDGSVRLQYRNQNDDRKPVEEEISTWTDISRIFDSGYSKERWVCGVKRDGSLLFAGEKPKNIEQIFPDLAEMKSVQIEDGEDWIGLCADGTLKMSERYRTNSIGVKILEEAKKTTFLQFDGSMGIRSDGTLYHPYRSYGEADLWTDLVCVESMAKGILGLQEDGSILVGFERTGNCSLSDMKDLEWVRYQHHPGLVAGTRSGELLYYGNIDTPESISWLDEMQLSEDGKVTLELFDGPKVLDNVKQSIELHHYNNYYVDDGQPKRSYGIYAILNQDGTVDMYLDSNEESVPKIYGMMKAADEWVDMVQLVTRGDSNLYGLKSDGTVWRAFDETTGVIDSEGDVIEIIATDSVHLLGVKKDGTVKVISLGHYTDEKDWVADSGMLQVNTWENIVHVAVGERHSVGLRSDGTVVAAGSNHGGQCEVEDWQDIVYLTAGGNVTLGITKDGDLKMTGSLY